MPSPDRPSPRPTITIASRVYAPEAAAASFRLRVCAKELTRFADVDVLTSRPRATGNRRIRTSVSIERTVSRWPVLRDSDGSVRGVVPYASFDIALVLRALVTPRPRAFLVEPPPTTGVAIRLASAIRRVPYVYYAADLVSHAASHGDYPRALVAVARTLEKLALRGAAHVVTVSPTLADLVEALGVERNRITVVGNGVDTDVFSPVVEPTRPPEIPRHAPLFTYAGTMNNLHGAEIFLKAFAIVSQRLPDAVLLMMGGGEEAHRIKELGAALPPGSFFFRENLPGPQAAAILRGSTAGLASVRTGGGYEMALATKALSTCATGTPVVFAGNGPTRDAVIAGELGWAVPWDPDAVAAAMIAAAGEPDEHARRERRAQWVQDNASLHAVAARVATVVRRVCRTPRRPTTA